MPDKNQDQNKDECPLCQVSEETLKRLEKSEPSKQSSQEKKSQKNNRLKKIGLLILVVVFVLSLFGIYKLITPSQRADQSKSNASQQSFVDNSRQKAPPEQGTPVKISSKQNIAPEFLLKNTEGREVSLSDFRNKKPVLLVFWATWCGYCAKELPDLKTFHQQHSKEVKVLVVVSGEDETTVKNYIKDNDISFSILLDKDRKVWNQYLVRGTPTHFLIDKQGEIITQRPGVAQTKDLEIMLTTLP